MTEDFSRLTALPGRTTNRPISDSHFGVVFSVHCLRMWRQKSKEPPDVIPRCLYEWLEIAGGRMELDLPAFRAIVEPTIAELHRKGKGARPTPDELTGALYDALRGAGVEVTLGPPAQSSTTR